MITDTWIEIHTHLKEHPKTYALMGALKVKKPMAVGLLVCLWLWAIDNVEDGDLTPYPDEAIARAAEWDKRPKLLIDALIQCGWVDRDSTRTVLHDWSDYAGRLIDKRQQARDRADKSRKRTRTVRAPSHNNNDNFSAPNAQHERDVSAECAPTVPKPYRTVPSDDKSSLSERAKKAPAQEPETPASAALSEIGKIYESTTGSLMPASLAREISFRLAENADPELLKEALHVSIGRRNEGAYFKAVMQSWTAQGIKTHQQLMDKVQTVAPTVKGGGHPTDRDVSFDVGEYVDLSMKRLLDAPAGAGGTP